jgi:uncharacterized RDD family membrane protein YckC
MNAPIHYVGFWPRMLAHNIDLLCLLPFFYGIRLLITPHWGMAVACTAIYILYHLIFEIGKWQGTPGKRMQRLKVVAVSGISPTIRQIALRNIAKLLSAGLLFLGFAMIGTTKKHQGLHDKLANTVVIYY